MAHIYSLANLRLAGAINIPKALPEGLAAPGGWQGNASGLEGGYLFHISRCRHSMFLMLCPSSISFVAVSPATGASRSRRAPGRRLTARGAAPCEAG